jgi:hypothetical protein
MGAVFVPSVTEGLAIGIALSSALEHETVHNAVAITATSDFDMKGIGQE